MSPHIAFAAAGDETLRPLRSEEGGRKGTVSKQLSEKDNEAEVSPILCAGPLHPVSVMPAQSVRPSVFFHFTSSRALHSLRRAPI